MQKRWPIFIMGLVLAAPFLLSIYMLSIRGDLPDRANGEWLNETVYVPKTDKQHWQLLWKNELCEPHCDELEHRLKRLKMALGKHQNELELVPLSGQISGQNSLTEKSLYVADRQGLVLLGYEGDEQSTYLLLKDLKVLMKHGGA